MNKIQIADLRWYAAKILENARAYLYGQASDKEQEEILGEIAGSAEEIAEGVAGLFWKPFGQTIKDMVIQAGQHELRNQAILAQELIREIMGVVATINHKDDFDLNDLPAVAFQQLQQSIEHERAIRRAVWSSFYREGHCQCPFPIGHADREIWADETAAIAAEFSETIMPPAPTAVSIANEEFERDFGTTIAIFCTLPIGNVFEGEVLPIKDIEPFEMCLAR